LAILRGGLFYFSRSIAIRESANDQHVFSLAQGSF
jgi:hypothetical protein